MQNESSETRQSNCSDREVRNLYRVTWSAQKSQAISMCSPQCHRHLAPTALTACKCPISGLPGRKKRPGGSSRKSCLCRITRPCKHSSTFAASHSSYVAYVCVTVPSVRSNSASARQHHPVNLVNNSVLLLFSPVFSAPRAEGATLSNMISSRTYLVVAVVVAVLASSEFVMAQRFSECLAAWPLTPPCLAAGCAVQKDYEC